MVEGDRDPDEPERQQGDGAELDLDVVAQGADREEQRRRPDDGGGRQGIAGQSAIVDGEIGDGEDEPDIQHHEQIREAVTPALRNGKRDAGRAE